MEIQFKIIIYGDIDVGNTIFEHLKKIFKQNAEEYQPRSLFIKIGTYYLKGSEWKCNFTIYNCEDKDFYASTRPATLMGADFFLLIFNCNNEAAEFRTLWYSINSLVNGGIEKALILTQNNTGSFLENAFEKIAINHQKISSISVNEITKEIVYSLFLVISNELGHIKMKLNEEKITEINLILEKIYKSPSLSR